MKRVFLFLATNLAAFGIAGGKGLGDLFRTIPYKRYLNRRPLSHHLWPSRL